MSPYCPGPESGAGCDTAFDSELHLDDDDDVAWESFSDSELLVSSGKPF